MEILQISLKAITRNYSPITRLLFAIYHHLRWYQIVQRLSFNEVEHINNDPLCEKGIEARRSGNHAEAHRYFLECKRKYFTSAVPYFLLSVSALDLYGVKAAISLVEKSIAFHPQWCQPLRYRGNLYIKLGLFEQAIQSFQVAITGMPHDAYSHDGLGVCYMETGEPELALQHSILSIQHNPYCLNFWTRLALHHEDMGDFDTAQSIRKWVHERRKTTVEIEGLNHKCTEMVERYRFLCPQEEQAERYY